MENYNLYNKVEGKNKIKNMKTISITEKRLAKNYYHHSRKKYLIHQARSSKFTSI